MLIMPFQFSVAFRQIPLFETHRKASLLKLIARLSLALILLTSVVNRHSGSESVVPGIEVLLSEQLGLIRGKRIGLITNHTGVDRKLRHDIDAFISTPGLRLVALFSPEHGIRGTVQAGEKVRSGVDEKTGIPV